MNYDQFVNYMHSVIFTESNCYGEHLELSFMFSIFGELQVIDSEKYPYQVNYELIRQMNANLASISIKIQLNLGI